MSNKIKLTNVKVCFFNLEPEERGGATFPPAVTIDATAPELQKQITDWYKENNIGKNGGAPSFKDYKGTIQFSLKLSKDNKTGTVTTRFAGLNGLTADDIGQGAVVDLIANAYPYNQYGGGVSCSVSAMVVREGKKFASADDDLNELLGEENTEESTDENTVPF